MTPCDPDLLSLGHSCFPLGSPERSPTAGPDHPEEALLSAESSLWLTRCHLLGGWPAASLVPVLPSPEPRRAEGRPLAVPTAPIGPVPCVPVAHREGASPLHSPQLLQLPRPPPSLGPTRSRESGSEGAPEGVLPSGCPEPAAPVIQLELLNVDGSSVSCPREMACRGSRGKFCL